MTALALILVLAHILGDFVFQPDNWVNDKRKKKHRSTYLYKHLGVHALSLAFLLQFQLTYWIGATVIIISHFFVDLAKLYLEGKMHRGRLFFLDQLAHLLVITAVVYSYHPFTIEPDRLLEPASLLFLTGILLVSFVSAILMKILMSRWNFVEDRIEDSLPQAGRYIGMLERLLVFSFIVFQQWQAIGWLIAAKSILRFSDLSRAKDRKLTEYVLIGTLLSFGLAIGTGILYLELRGNI